MKKIIPVLVFCGALLGCASKPVIPEKKPEEIKYVLNIEDSELSSFFLTASRNNFSIEFSPSIIGNGSIAFLKMTDWKSENDFVDIFVHFYNVENFKEVIQEDFSSDVQIYLVDPNINETPQNRIFYDVHINLVKQDLGITVNKGFSQNEDFEMIPAKSWYARSSVHGKSVECFDNDGDGKLEYLVFNDKQIIFSKEGIRDYPAQIPCEKLRDIISKGFETYLESKKEMKKLGFDF